MGVNRNPVINPWREGYAKPPKREDRPRCPNCDKPLTAIIWTHHETVEKDGQTVTLMEGMTKYWSGKYQRYGEFCTLRCCAEFANAAYRAGYRKVKRDE